MCQAWASPILTSPSDAPSSRPYIKLSTLQALAEDWMALPNPQGHPGPLAFIFFSMMALAIAQWPSSTVFVVSSTCNVLPA